ncbi:hypothetical protein AXK38_00550 [Streptococcus mitis]|nr:hypothetical protein AXK38_00550 [Streptococcus mitis]
MFLNFKKFYSLCSIGLFLLAVYSNNKILLLISFILLLSISRYYYIKIDDPFNNIKDLIKEVRDKNYFYILDESMKTDIEKRRIIDKKLFEFSSFIIMIIMSVFALILIFFSNEAVIFVLGIISYILFFVDLMIYLLRYRYYWVSFQYYLIPIAVSILILNSFDDIQKFSVILFYFFLVLVCYLALTIVLPLPYLRKVSKSTFFVGVILSVTIPIIINNFLNPYMVDTIKKSIQIVVTPEMIEQIGLPKEINEYFSNKQLAEIISQYREIVIDVKLDAEKEVFTTIGNMCISSYTLGTIIINYKIKLGDDIAKDKYRQLSKYTGMDLYREIRGCVFYGGENYKDKIMENENYEKLVQIIESNKNIPKQNIPDTFFLRMLL